MNFDILLTLLIQLAWSQAMMNLAVSMNASHETVVQKKNITSYLWLPCCIRQNHFPKVLSAQLQKWSWSCWSTRWWAKPIDQKRSWSTFAWLLVKEWEFVLFFIKISIAQLELNWTRNESWSTCTNAQTKWNLKLLIITDKNHTISTIMASDREKTRKCPISNRNKGMQSSTLDATFLLFPASPVSQGWRNWEARLGPLQDQPVSSTRHYLLVLTRYLKYGLDIIKDILYIIYRINF